MAYPPPLLNSAPAVHRARPSGKTEPETGVESRQIASDLRKEFPRKQHRSDANQLGDSIRSHCGGGAADARVITGLFDFVNNGPNRMAVTEKKKAAEVPRPVRLAVPQPDGHCSRQGHQCRARLTPEAAPTFPWRGQAVAQAHRSHSTSDHLLSFCCSWPTNGNRLANVKGISGFLVLKNNGNLASSNGGALCESSFSAALNCVIG